VPGDQHERDVHQPVVEENGAREAEARVALAQPQQHARDGEQDGERGRDRGVELLTRVEPPLRTRHPPQPQHVVLVEPVEFAERPPEPAPVAERDDERERHEPRDRRVDVHVLHERPA
jgi:hypothetical protein